MEPKCTANTVVHKASYSLLVLAAYLGQRKTFFSLSESNQTAKFSVPTLDTGTSEYLEKVVRCPPREVTTAHCYCGWLMHNFQDLLGDQLVRIRISFIEWICCIRFWRETLNLPFFHFLGVWFAPFCQGKRNYLSYFLWHSGLRAAVTPVKVLWKGAYILKKKNKERKPHFSWALEYFYWLARFN